MFYKCLECENEFTCEKPILDMNMNKYGFPTGFREVVRCPRCDSENVAKKSFDYDGEFVDEDE